MKSPTSLELPARFQKLFVSVTLLFLAAYFVGTIYQYVYTMQLGYAGYSSWEIVAVIARLAIPTILLVAGVAISKGTWWRRVMVGSLSAVAGMLTQTTLLSVSTMSFMQMRVQTDYALLEAGVAIAGILAAMGVLMAIRINPGLWQWRYVAYSSVIIGAAVMYVLRDAIDQWLSGGYPSEYLASMVIANAILLALALLAYVVLRGMALSARIYRVVLVIMMGVMVTMAISFIVSAIAQAGAGADMINGLYGVIGIVVPLAVYGAALWFARPERIKASPVEVTE